MGFHNPWYFGIFFTNNSIVSLSIILIGLNTVVVFPPFRILRASVHCVIMSLRALHLLVAVHALAAHLGQSP